MLATARSLDGRIEPPLPPRNHVVAAAPARRARRGRPARGHAGRRPGRLRQDRRAGRLRAHGRVPGRLAVDGLGRRRRRHVRRHARAGAARGSCPRFGERVARRSSAAPAAARSRCWPPSWPTSWPAAAARSGWCSTTSTRSTRAPSETADAVGWSTCCSSGLRRTSSSLIGSRTLPALGHAVIASAGRLRGVAAEELRFTPRRGRRLARRRAGRPPRPPRRLRPDRRLGGRAAARRRRPCPATRWPAT